MQVTATVAQNEEEGMVRPLTKRRSNGQLYTRPPGVEAQIEEALKLDLATLRHRLETSDLQMPGYLRSECLVHLIREAVRTGDQDRIIDMVLPKLLLRCSVNLRKKIPDSALFDAESIREEVLSQLSEMFASDGTGSNLNELDFFEVHFNQAFRAHRIDLVKKEKNRLKHIVSLPLQRPDEQEESNKDVLAWLSKAARTPAIQESKVFLSELWEAVNALPSEERQAVVFYLMGYKEESQNPDEVTVAKLCKCSGRAIRNRRTRAAAKLKRFKEDQLCPQP